MHLISESDFRKGNNKRTNTSCANDDKDIDLVLLSYVWGEVCELSVGVYDGGRSILSHAGVIQGPAID